MLPAKESLPPQTRWQRLQPHLHKWGERLYPSVFGIAIFVLAWRKGIAAAEYKALVGDVLPSVVSVAAILAGFQGTTHTILLSMRKSRIVRQMEQAGHFSTLMRFVTAGVLSLLLFVVAAVVVMTCNSAQLNAAECFPSSFRSVMARASAYTGFSPHGQSFTVAMLAGIFTHAMCASLRIIQLVVKMIGLGGEEIL